MMLNGPMNSIPFEPNKFNFPPERQFHSLKHFSEIDADYFQKMLQLGAWNRADIIKRMQKFGSKFDPGFAENPIKILQYLNTRSDYLLDYRKKSRERIELKILLKKSKAFTHIGWDTLARLDELGSGTKVQTRTRNDFLIKYAKGSPVPTLEMNMIFELAENDFQLITVFPGKYAPPFPDSAKQIKEEYIECAQFWDRHIFLVE
ncbi:hypothetical protein ACFLRQ_01585 [Bacteroidota bacterium]